MASSAQLVPQIPKKGTSTEQKINNFLPNIISKYIQPEVDNLNQSPIGALNPFNFHPDQVLPRIAKSVNDQGSKIRSSYVASSKRSVGQTPTAKDLANEKAGTALLMGSVMGSLGEAPEAMAKEDVAAAAPKPASPEFTDYQKTYQTSPEMKATRQLTLPKEEDPVGAENAVHETLDRHGITHPDVEQQLAALPAKRKQLFQQAQQKIASDPDFASIDDKVVPNIMDALKSQTRLGDITAPQARAALAKYLSDLHMMIPEEALTPQGAVGAIHPMGTPLGEPLGPTTEMGTSVYPSYNLGATKGIDPKTGLPLGGRLYESGAKGTVGTNNGPIFPPSKLTAGLPEENMLAEKIGYDKLFNMKTVANKDYGAVNEKLDKNRPLTDADKINYAVRNGLDKTITERYPGVKQDTMDISHLYKAKDPLAKARPKFEPPVQSAPKPSLAQNIKNIGFGAAGFGAAAKELGLNPVPAIGGTLGYLGSRIFGQPIKKKQEQIGDHTDDILPQSSTSVNSSPYSGLKADPKTGAVELPVDPDPNQRQYMSSQDYQDGLASLASRYPAGSNDPHYVVAKTALDAQYGEDQKQADEVFKGNNVKNFMDNASSYNADGKALIPTLHSLPPQFWNGVENAGSIKAYQDPQYADELQQIDNFNNEYTSAYKSVTGEAPKDNQLLSSANSPDQAAKKFLAMQQFIAGTYRHYLSPYLSLTSGTGRQTKYATPQPVNTPVAASAPEQHVDMSTPASYLPSISIPGTQ